MKVPHRGRSLGAWSSTLAASALVMAGLAAANELRASSGFYHGCAPTASFANGDSLFKLHYDRQLVQPLASTANVAACSLGVRWSTYSFPEIEVVVWDPAGLAPDPSTVALRTRRFDPSGYALSALATSFSPAIVTREIEGIADGRPDPPAFLVQHHVQGLGSGDLWLHHDTNGDASIPIARSGFVSQPLAALPGPHPVLAHAACEMSGAIHDLRVLQAVMTTDRIIPGSSDEIAQRFRVPRPVTLSWAEIANSPSTPTNAAGPVEVTLFDADESGFPPVEPGPPLTRGVTSELVYSGESSRWVPTFDFDAQVVLLPGRDYWLVVRHSDRWNMLARNVDGSEPLAFSTSIGPLVRRPTDHDDWVPAPGLVLSFRLIGTESTVIGVEPPSLVHGFTLLARPNPSQGDVRLSWSGAAGPVRVQVMDVSGRVVGEAVGQGADGREWVWDGRLRGGRRLAGGVFLLRATDGAGRQASRRVVLIR